MLPSIRARLLIVIGLLCCAWVLTCACGVCMQYVSAAFHFSPTLHVFLRDMSQQQHLWCSAQGGGVCIKDGNVQFENSPIDNNKAVSRAPPNSKVQNSACLCKVWESLFSVSAVGPLCDTTMLTCASGVCAQLVSAALHLSQLADWPAV